MYTFSLLCYITISTVLVKFKTLTDMNCYCRIMRDCVFHDIVCPVTRVVWAERDIPDDHASFVHCEHFPTKIGQS